MINNNIEGFEGNTMKIDRLVEVDLKQCVEAHRDAFKAPPWDESWSEEKSLKRLSDIYYTPGFIGFKCMEQGKVIGAVLGNIEEDYQGQYYFLKEMFVHTDYQHHGIGSQLLNKIEEEADREGLGGIILFTSRVYGTEQFYKKNHYEVGQGLVLMAKHIK